MKPEGMILMVKLLEQVAARHRHLCPRQVLGVRMGVLAGRVLDEDKRLLTLVETEGCAADAVSVASSCTLGNRRLRVVDFGKVAATFVDTRCDKAIRSAPGRGIREAAQKQATDTKSRWHAQLEAYKVMSDAELLEVQRVELMIPLEKLLDKPGCRVNCKVCGEEIINEREVLLEGKNLLLSRQGPAAVT